MCFVTIKYTCKLLNDSSGFEDTFMLSLFGDSQEFDLFGDSDNNISGIEVLEDELDFEGFELNFPNVSPISPYYCSHI